MKNVLVRGPLLSQSGYGVHARQVYRYLSSKKNINIKTEILPWGITPWNIDVSDPVIEEIISKSDWNQVDKYDLSFQIQLPNEWDNSKANYNIGVTAGVETDLCNPEWTTNHVAKMDKVIVPSEHSKKSLVGVNSEAKEKTVVIPESFYDEINTEPSSKKIKLRTNFNFLTVGVLTGESVDSDRKNLFYLIKWFLEAFRGVPDVGLIVKTNRGRDTSIDKKITKGILKKVKQELSHPDNPALYLVHGSMTRKEMNELYGSSKAFVSLTRGEGFGLPHLEAAASGLPVIATDWSAHTEFLNLGNWIKVDYDLKYVSQSRIDNFIFMNGSRWAEANESDFKKKIVKFKDNYSDYLNSALELKEKIQENYSWKSVQEKYDLELGSLLN